MSPDDLVHPSLLGQRESLAPDPLPVGRRGFLAGASIATGYALAASPVMAQTVVKTDAAGLATGKVNVRTADGKQMPAYYARPAQGSKFATVIVIQEIFGVHEYIQDTCRRLAKIGYLAVAPELYFRQGNPATAPDIPAILRDIVSKVPDAQVASDIDATVAWAGGNVGKGETARLGVTGFCWGGRQTWLYAAHNPKVRAAVAWYGPLGGNPGPNTPKTVIDLAASIDAPVLGLYGGADQGIPLDTVERMRGALRAANKKSEIVVYPDTPHGFHADYRPTFREGPARDGWNRMEVWFSRNLV